jgi:hypothetical protein
MKGLGNHLMKGRLTKDLPCMCCTIYNFKYKELEKVHRKEISLARVKQAEDGSFAETLEDVTSN